MYLSFYLSHSKHPSILEYFSYMFNFHSFLAGPSCTIREYLSFMDGSNLQPPVNPNQFANAKEHTKAPSPLYPALSKLFYALLCLTVMMVFSQYYTFDSVIGKELELHNIMHTESALFTRM